MLSLRLGLTYVVICCGLTAQRPLNLLFYGNSYSLDNATVPAMVRAIATQAGHPTPRIVPRLFGGTNLAYHRNDPAQVAAIANSLPAGETWDFVVIQGLSVEPTVNQGNPAAFRANAVGIVGNVRAHSPSARAILYQTWARGPGHAFYPAAFPEVWAMHTEVRDNYAAAASDIDQAFGPGTARVARAGNGVAMMGYNPAYYHPDLSHPGKPMTILAAMTIYAAIWQSSIYSIATDFSGNGLLATHFRNNLFDPADWTLVRGYADMVAERAIRRFPGSGEDLVTRCTSALPDASAIVRSTMGSDMTFELRSPMSRYNGATGVLFVDVRPTGPTPGFPELWLGASAVPLAAGSLTGGLRQTVRLPFLSEPVLVQGLAIAASRATGHPFTCTDGQELRTN